MTDVYCTFKNCIYWKKDTENSWDIGICTKDFILLDDAVNDIMFGCPDAEWIDEEEEDDA